MDAHIVDYPEAKHLVDNGAQLVDVRTIEEYEQLYVGGKNLPLDELVERHIEVLGTDKTQPIVLFCRSGNRSKQAARLLQALGYTNLYDLESYKYWQAE